MVTFEGIFDEVMIFKHKCKRLGIDLNTIAYVVQKDRLEQMHKEVEAYSGKKKPDAVTIAGIRVIASIWHKNKP